MVTELRAVLTIVPDEARVSHVHTRVSGWIQELFVRTTGERVRRGQPLATIFSQELLASQNEYLAALRASPGAPSPIARGARSRLLVFGMTEGAIRALERRGQAARNVTIVAPRAGVVFHRGISAGTSVDPSTELFTVIDLSRVWALAEVPEADAAAIAVGTRTRIDVPGSGRAPTDAQVAFVYPTLSEQTRTARVRLPLANDDGALRPGMFGTATFALAAREASTVPRDAIVDTGIRQHVFVAERPDHFVPRTVRLGMQSEDRVEVREGLRAGERVVSEGVFLIDSESRLRASGGGMGHAHGAQPSRSGEHEEHPPTSRAESPHAGHGGM
jgi:membrane fusion protein, copper/silver efflux system